MASGSSKWALMPLAAGLGRVDWWRLLWWAPLPLLALPALGFTAVIAVLNRIVANIPIRPPSKRQLAEVDASANPLYRALPALSGKFAWRPLGNFPSPLHCVALSLAGGTCAAEVWVKREDLVSDGYGGNKVRTLQYVIGAFEACVEERSESSSGASPRPRLLALGTAGSNMVVATKVHAALRGGELVGAVEGFPLAADEPEMDNTLNYLSALSLPGAQAPFAGGAAAVLLAALRAGRGAPDTSRPWVLPPGGNCAAGVLGQAGGALELAEQVERGEVPDPDGIVLALGSACTTAGLALGVAIARAAGMKAFRKPGFRIHAQPIHPLILRLHRLFGFLHSQLPNTVGRGIRDAAAAIAARGGPDLTEAALRVMREELEISTELDICGKYGAHSEASLCARRDYDAALDSDASPRMWLCGHFTAKSFALLLRLLRADLVAGRPLRTFVFWASKSSVQPRGAGDEWSAFAAERRTTRALERWGVLGGICGHPDAPPASEENAARPAEGPEQYRALMRSILA